MAITPSRPRQRVSPSPTGKDSLLANGNSTVSSRANGSSRHGDRKEQQQCTLLVVASQHSIENFATKRPSSSRNRCCLYWCNTCYKQRMAVFLTFIVLASTALSVYIRTAPMFRSISDISLEDPRRSLLLKIDDSNYPENTPTGTFDQHNVSDNPHPRIVWLMSFPNRYVIYCYYLHLTI